ncbi:MAG: DNA polymerase III subunit chi, partial [Methylobacter sp.]
MAEVSFYILPTESLDDRYLFACKLIEKAYRSGSFCYVLTDSAEQSRIIDDLLWTFRAGSFIPHQVYTGEPPDVQQVILIGSLNAPESWQKVLFNLSSHYPDVGPQTERILEILDNSETTKAAG